MFRFASFFLIPLLFFSFALPAQEIEKFLQKFGKSGDPREKPLYLGAGAMEIKEGHQGERIWVATEGVHLWQGDPEKPVLELICDESVVWFKPLEKKEDAPTPRGPNPTAISKKGKKPQKEDKAETALFYAAGNVHFRWGDTFFRGEEILFDLVGNRGLVVNGAMRAQFEVEKKKVPLYVRAKKLWAHSQNEFVARGASFSTCQFGEPHYHFSTDHLHFVRIDKDVYVQARENALYGLGVPFFYIPYIAGETIRHWPIKTFRYGRSSKWGQHLLTTWGGSLYENKEKEKTGIHEALWLLDLDVREKRGLAGGPHLKYDGALGGPFSGHIWGYYLYDQPLNEMGTDLSKGPVEGEDAAWDKRHRVYGIHRHEFPDKWRLDMELSLISDRDLMLQFFEKEAREDKESETYLYVNKSWNNHAFSFLSRFRPNDFQSQIEYLPQGKYHVLHEPLWTGEPGSAYWSSHMELSYVRRKDDEAAPSAFDGKSIFRADWDNTLYFRFLLGPLHLLPFATGRMSYFEEGADGENHRFRGTAGTGIEIATTFHRLYRARNDFFQLDRVLHVFTPHFRYEWIYANSVDSGELIPFDSLESVDKMQRIQVILTNRLRTLRNKRIVDFFFFEAIFAYLPERDLGDGKTDQGVDISSRWEKFDNLKLDLRWSVRSDVYLWSRSEFNFQLSEFEIVNGGASYHFSDRLSVALDGRYHRNNSLTSTISMSYRPNPKWAFTTSLQYDFRENEFREVKFLVRRIFHRFCLDIQVKFDQVDNDTSVTGDFYPLDFFDKRNDDRWLAGWDPASQF